MSQPKNLLDNRMNDIDLRFTNIQLYNEEIKKLQI